MSKKERIEYLESEVAGLHDKVSELIAKVEELELKLKGTLFIPYNAPAIQPKLNYWNTCPNCGGLFTGSYHACWTVNPNRPYTITVTNTVSGKTEVLK